MVFTNLFVLNVSHFKNLQFLLIEPENTLWNGASHVI
jgi:hypothetical protein